MKLIKIKELGIEVQQEYALKNIRVREIIIPKGMRLLTLDELLHIYNKHNAKFKDLDRIDEAIQNPIDRFRKERPIWALWFGGVGDRSDLDGDYGLAYYYGVRGVRFCRDVKK